MDLLSDDALNGGEDYSVMFHNLIKKRGTDFASGVPCGVIKEFIQNFASDPEILHLPGQNEPECIGIAAGAYLGGMNPVVYMQNSGMLKSTNEIGSILVPCKIPVLLLVSYRGCPGEDAAQHFVTGRITKPTLEELGLFYREIEEDSIDETVSECFDFMSDSMLPSAVLVRRDWLKRTSKEKGFNRLDNPSVSVSQCNEKSKGYEEIVGLALEKISDRRIGNDLSREDALEAVANASCKYDAVISSTGLMSRSLYEKHDGPNMFYNTGGFGMVSSIGLGFAAARPDVKTIVVDGDGSLLTNFGTLRTIGGYGPKNLVHVVLDNGSYGSCSEESTTSKDANIGLVAALQGYSWIAEVDTPEGVADAISELGVKEGPGLVHVKTVLGGRRDFKRPMDLAEMTTRFKMHFSDGEAHE